MVAAVPLVTQVAVAAAFHTAPALGLHQGGADQRPVQVCEECGVSGMRKCEPKRVQGAVWAVVLHYERPPWTCKGRSGKCGQAACDVIPEHSGCVAQPLKWLLYWPADLPLPPARPLYLFVHT